MHIQVSIGVMVYQWSDTIELASKEGNHSFSENNVSPTLPQGIFTITYYHTQKDIEI
jgi:hypothetical protein